MGRRDDVIKVMHHSTKRYLFNFTRMDLFKCCVPKVDNFFLNGSRCKYEVPRGVVVGLWKTTFFSSSSAATLFFLHFSE